MDPQACQLQGEVLCTKIIVKQAIVVISRELDYKELLVSKKYISVLFVFSAISIYCFCNHKAKKEKKSTKELKKKTWGNLLK